LPRALAALLEDQENLHAEQLSPHRARELPLDLEGL
jgi:hypothetical protein